jgi:HEAT repeat protein
VLLAAIERSHLPPLQARLRQSMEELGRAHQAQLVALLDDNDADVLRGAARLTGQLGIASAAPKLTALLQRPDPTVRRAAVEALAPPRPSKALEA